MREIIIKPLANVDLEEIWSYTYNKWSQEQANKYFRELTEGIKSIAENSVKGIRIDHIKNGYRQHKINHHYIFYKATDRRIEIIRVLHEKMDLLRHLH